MEKMYVKTLSILRGESNKKDLSASEIGRNEI